MSFWLIQINVFILKIQCLSTLSLIILVMVTKLCSCLHALLSPVFVLNYILRLLLLADLELMATLHIHVGNMLQGPRERKSYFNGSYFVFKFCPWVTALLKTHIRWGGDAIKRGDRSRETRLLHGSLTLESSTVIFNTEALTMGWITVTTGDILVPVGGFGYFFFFSKTEENTMCCRTA